MIPIFRGWNTLGRVTPTCEALSKPSSVCTICYKARRRATTSARQSGIRHSHLRGEGSGGFISYDQAHEVQEQRRHDFLRWKSLSDEQRAEVGPIAPTLISFESQPTYTLGRRQEDLSADQAAVLSGDLRIRLSRDGSPIQHNATPVIRRTKRGGLTTYHGPGQLVLWPILDMHSSLYPSFSVDSYAHCLEATTSRLLKSLFGLETVASEENPGVWIPDGSGLPKRKIAAMGVHHRRYITGLGIALNIDMPTGGDGEGAAGDNPWARFAPCGLASDGVTSLSREAGERYVPDAWDMLKLASAWRELFEEALQNPSLR